MKNDFHPTIQGKYIGNLRVESTHILSNNRIFTDAPPDNNGKGEAFSPTDLVATALASCMLTIAGIRAIKSNFRIGKANFKVQKVMQSNPRKIEKIKINIFFAKNFSEKERIIIETAMINCPVVLSINRDIQQELHFYYNSNSELANS